MKNIKMVFASANEGKIAEMKYLINKNLNPGKISGINIELLSLKDVGFTDEIIENGATFEENAEIKARAVYDFINKTEKTGMICFGDDSGLCVDYLNGEPGIYSARYGSISGERATYEQCVGKVLGELDGVPDDKRTAQFYCAIYCVISDGENFCVTGKCGGIITHEKIGGNGFCYDPIFYYPPENKTFAQMSDEDKNKFSHRALAAEQFAKKIVQYVNV